MLGEHRDERHEQTFEARAAALGVCSCGRYGPAGRLLGRHRLLRGGPIQPTNPRATGPGHGACGAHQLHDVHTVTSACAVRARRAPPRRLSGDTGTITSDAGNAPTSSSVTLPTSSRSTHPLPWEPSTTRSASNA